jgi:ribosomal protein L11 methyltransferase
VTATDTPPRPTPTCEPLVTLPSDASSSTERVRVELTVRPGEAEIAAARLWAAGAIGVWERPDGLTAWFTRPDPAVPAGSTITPEPDRDWQAEWKATIAPVSAGRFTIVPTWLVADHRAGSEEVTLVLDPAGAFGSGHHATTTLCLEALDDLDRAGRLAGRRVADVGCGTGILAIAAAKLGAQVDAVDIDPDAVPVARENATRNGVTLDPRVGSVEALDGRADIVVANLLTDVLVHLARELVAACTDRLVVSGIAAERAEVVVDALEAAGARLVDRRDRDGWTRLIAAVDHRQVDR